MLLLLEELGTPYEIKHYARLKSMMAPPELKRVHPLGKSPVVTDGGDTLAETGHIIDTLIDRYGAGTGLRPASGTPEHLRYGYYLHYAEGSLAPLMLLSIVLSMIGGRMPLPLRPVGALISRGMTRSFLQPQLDLHLGVLEGELSKRSWFAGDSFSGADVIMSFPMQAFRALGQLQRFPNLLAWLQRLEARPAWTRTIQKGGALTLKFG